MKLRTSTIFVCVLMLLSSLPLFGLDGDSLIVLNFAGDVTFANHFEQHVKNHFEYPFAKFPEFAEADISMVNLENPLTKGGIAAEKLFVFRARPKYVRVLERGGVDIVNLANNHMYDYGEQGLRNTIETLDRAGIRHVGAGVNEKKARTPVILIKSGLRLGFLAYYGLRRHSGSHPATADSAGTALRNLKYIREDIRALRDSADLIFVNFHWGLEKEHYPQPEQIWFAHKTLDYGADMIIGHHPHVLQGIERYKDKYIAYSLGNFIFGGNSRTHEDTAVLQVNIDWRTQHIKNVHILPVAVDYWQPHLLKGEHAKAIADSVKKYSLIFHREAL